MHPVQMKDDQLSSNKSQTALLSQTLLRNYSLELANLNNKVSPEEVPASIRNFFLPYIKHIHSIDNTVYCLNNLFELNESILTNSNLSRKLNDIMRTLKKNLSELTDDLINQLTTNNSVSPRSTDVCNGEIRE